VEGSHQAANVLCGLHSCPGGLQSMPSLLDVDGVSDIGSVDCHVLTGRLLVQQFLPSVEWHLGSAWQGLLSQLSSSSHG
jgi:hypothetical protein